VTLEFKIVHKYEA